MSSDALSQNTKNSSGNKTDMTEVVQEQEEIRNIKQIVTNVITAEKEEIEFWFLFLHNFLAYSNWQEIDEYKDQDDKNK